MLSTRTPLRVSFFGGGTDYPEYFGRHPGAVLGTAIDKFIYISALQLERFIDYKYRLAYRIIEEVRDIDQIQHPVFREVIRFTNLPGAWNFGVLSSLPARSGLGSSSAFVVGLLKLIASLKNENWTRYDLAQKAIYLEREVLSENVGVQDQFHAAFGGLNRYDFTENGLTISPVRLHTEVRDRLNRSLYLLHTGAQRYASEVVEDQVQKTASKQIDRPLHHLYKLVSEGTRLLEGQNADEVVSGFGAMLHDGWMTKRTLTSRVTTPQIDALYEFVTTNGALGGKLCGAGGAGFMLLVVPPETASHLQEKLGDRSLIPIAIEESGATLVQS